MLYYRVDPCNGCTGLFLCQGDFMSKGSYAQKKMARIVSSLADLGPALGTPTQKEEVIPRPTILEVAQELQAKTKFTDFVIAGNGATLFFGGVIFGYIIEERERGEVRFFKVLRSDNPKLPEGFTLSTVEVSRLASRDVVERYLPRGDCANPVLENQRAVMINTLLDAIADSGGNGAVLQAIDAAARQATLQYEREARAGKIRHDINSGQLLSDPLKMFNVEEVSTFGFVIGDKPMVFRSGMRPVDKKGEYLVHCVWVLSAPFGTSGEYREGSFLQLRHLFDAEHPHPSVSALAEAIRALFTEEQMTEAKRLVKLFVGEKADEAEEDRSTALVTVPVQQFVHTSPEALQ